LKVEGLPVFKVAFAKDAEQDVLYPFALEKTWVRNDVDEDGIEDLTQPVFSMVVRPRVDAAAKDPAINLAEDDDILDAWIRKEVTAGNTPSKNSLKSQSTLMKPGRTMPRDAIFGAVDRLIAAGRLEVVKSGGRGGQGWLRPIDKAGP
jgi:hypothetical protein